MRVHVVEDEKSLRDAAAFYLKDAGLEVSSSDDGTKAISDIEKSKPDVILVDLMLPGLDGLELLRKLRAAGHNQPAIIMTNLDRSQIQASDEELKKLDVHDVFLKVHTNFSDLPAAILGAHQQTYRLDDTKA